MASVIRSDRYYVPRDRVDVSKLHNMELELFTKICNTCPFLKQRICDECLDCEGFIGKFVFHNQTKIKKKEYVGLTPGNMQAIKSVVPRFRKLKIKDRRVTIPFQSSLEFTASDDPFYGYQKKAVAELLKYEEGLLISPPRSGKTAMFCRSICQLKERSLIIAHQDDLLTQFRDTFYGNPDKGTIAFTNAKEIEEDLGYPVVKIASKTEDYFDKRLDVVLTTYQKLLFNEDLRERVLKSFGANFVDEVHRQAATGYSKVMVASHARYRYACTGTQERKDGRHQITDFITGPVRHTVVIPSLVPKIKVYESKLRRKVDVKSWPAIIRALQSNGPRNDDIVKHIVKDLKKGKHIVVPATGRQYIEILTKEINRVWQETTGNEEEIAKVFYRMPKSQKEQVLSDAIAGKTRCVVAMRSMLLGINVPIWDTLYAITPMNNAPNFEQESKRICTPYKGKKPVIKFFVDLKCGAAFGCFLATLRTCRALGYKVTPKTDEKISALIASKGALGVNKGMKRIGLGQKLEI